MGIICNGKYFRIVLNNPQQGLNITVMDDPEGITTIEDVCVVKYVE